jgi:hypothetical protein
MEYWRKIYIYIYMCVCGIVDVWWDNHVLIFYAIIYYHYAEYTHELQLDDLQVGG